MYICIAYTNLVQILLCKQINKDVGTMLEPLSLVMPCSVWYVHIYHVTALLFQLMFLLQEESKSHVVYLKLWTQE